MVSVKKVITAQLPRGPHGCSLHSKCSRKVVCESWNSANSCYACDRCWSITGSPLQYGALFHLYSDLGEVRKCGLYFLV